MLKQKNVIVVYKQGKEQGYIKSVSYKNNTFDITKNKDAAKKYTTENRIYEELDFLSMFIVSGYNFCYKPYAIL